MRDGLFDRLKARRPDREAVRRLLGDAMWVLLGAALAVVVVVICGLVALNALIDSSSGS